MMAAEDTPPIEREFEVDGLRLCGKMWGSEGEPVIALHGWLDNAASFDSLVPLLIGRKVLALDLPGHGFSDHKPASGNYAIWDDLRSVVGVADQLGWSTFTLLGHSRGAIISVLLAAVLPQRVTQLICLDGGVTDAIPASAVVDQLGKYVYQYGKNKRPSIGFSNLEEAVAARQKATGMSASSARTIIARATYEKEGSWYWRSDRRLFYASPVKFSAEQLQVFFAAIRCPSMVVIADQGMGQWLDKLPVSWPDTFVLRHIVGNHHCHMDEPVRDIAALLATWWGELASSESTDSVGE